MKTQRVKGTRDIAGPDMAAFRKVGQVFSQACAGWGYREVKTPTIEYLHLFTSVGTLTPQMLAKVYTFLDWDGWSGERVVLRPDGTIPVARLYVESPDKGKLARLFYFTNIFMFDESGRKSRERWQAGVEMIGADTPLAEVELVALSREILADLGVTGNRLVISHAGLIRTLVAHLGVDEDAKTKIFHRILEGDTKAFGNLTETGSALYRAALPFLQSKGSSTKYAAKFKASLPKGNADVEKCLEDLIQVTGLLDEAGFDYEIDIASGTGFEYYTGIVFQYYLGKEKICGGGRYDNLIPAMGGGKMGALGFAVYTDKLLPLVTITADEVAPVMVDIAKGGSVKEVLALTGALRAAGYAAQMDIGRPSVAQEPCRVEITAGPEFTVRLDGSKKKAKTYEQVIEFLGGRRG
ncbi:ATP phosphoribosyltransferase regulatory subunit [Chloroflexota bacterium]